MKRLDIGPSVFQCFRNVFVGSKDAFPGGHIRTQCSWQNYPLSSRNEQVPYNFTGPSQSNCAEKSDLIRQAGHQGGERFQAFIFESVGKSGHCVDPKCSSKQKSGNGSY